MVKYLNKIILIAFLGLAIHANVHSQKLTHVLQFFPIEENNNAADSAISQDIMIDSCRTYYVYPLYSKEDNIAKIHDSIFLGIYKQNLDKQLIAALQDSLNHITDDDVKCILLSNQENILLYIYLNKWDSVLNAITKLEYPYKIDEFSFGEESEYVWIGMVRRNLHFVIIKKQKFMNDEIYRDISNASLSKEQRDFLMLFIPSYFGHNYTPDNIKVKTAYKNFKKKYPESKYSKYITDNKAYH